MFSFTSLSMVSFSYLNMFKIAALKSLLILTFEPSQGQFLLPALLPVYGNSLLFICMYHDFFLKLNILYFGSNSGC